MDSINSISPCVVATTALLLVTSTLETHACIFVYSWVTWGPKPSGTILGSVSAEAATDFKEAEEICGLVRMQTRYTWNKVVYQTHLHSMLHHNGVYHGKTIDLVLTGALHNVLSQSVIG